MKLVAIKSMTYATRRLEAGDRFEASLRDARILIAIKKAQEVKTRKSATVGSAALEIVTTATTDGGATGEVEALSDAVMPES